MGISSLLPRSRVLMTNLIALAFLLAILVFAPAGAVADPGWTCTTGCVNWDARYGCLEEMTCCVNDQGGWFCTGSH